MEQKIVDRVTDIVKVLTNKKNLLEIPTDEDLFVSGKLDSVMVVGLITNFEDNFQIAVPPTEFNPENFTTIGGMSRMISRLLDANNR